MLTDLQTVAGFERVRRSGVGAANFKESIDLYETELMCSLAASWKYALEVEDRSVRGCWGVAAPQAPG